MQILLALALVSVAAVAEQDLLDPKATQPLCATLLAGLEQADQIPALRVLPEEEATLLQLLAGKLDTTALAHLQSHLEQPVHGVWAITDAAAFTTIRTAFENEVRLHDQEVTSVHVFGKRTVQGTLAADLLLTLGGLGFGFQAAPIVVGNALTWATAIVAHGVHFFWYLDVHKKRRQLVNFLSDVAYTVPGDEHWIHFSSSEDTGPVVGGLGRIAPEFSSPSGAFQANVRYDVLWGQLPYRHPVAFVFASGSHHYISYRAYRGH